MERYLSNFLQPYTHELQSAIEDDDSERKRMAAYQAGVDGTRPYKGPYGYDADWSLDALRAAIDKAQPALEKATHRAITATKGMEAAQAKAGMPELLPWPGFRLTNKQWEMPVMSGSYTVGFIDFVAHYRYPLLGACCKSDPSSYTWRTQGFPWWEICWEDRQIFFEVKTAIPSLGELLRQLGQYREYLKRPNDHDRPIFVVSPDARFADKIREQGYGFIQVPMDLTKANGQPTDDGWLFGR